MKTVLEIKFFFLHTTSIKRKKSSHLHLGTTLRWRSTYIITAASNCYGQLRNNCRLGGLDLSRHGLDRDSRSRHWQRAGLDSRDFLDSLKNDISTNLDNFYAIKSWFVSIFIFVSIETLDLDTGREPVSTVEKISTLQKS